MKRDKIIYFATIVMIIFLSSCMGETAVQPEEPEIAIVNSPTAELVVTNTATAEPTQTPPSSPTLTQTPTSTPTVTPSPTNTATPEPTSTATQMPTTTPTPGVVNTAVPEDGVDQPTPITAASNSEMGDFQKQLRIKVEEAVLGIDQWQGSLSIDENHNSPLGSLPPAASNCEIIISSYERVSDLLIHEDTITEPMLNNWYEVYRINVTEMIELMTPWTDACRAAILNGEIIAMSKNGYDNFLQNSLVPMSELNRVLNDLRNAK